jgi:hypothetical protein
MAIAQPIGHQAEMWFRLVMHSVHVHLYAVFSSTFLSPVVSPAFGIYGRLCKEFKAIEMVTAKLVPTTFVRRPACKHGAVGSVMLCNAQYVQGCVLCAHHWGDFLKFVWWMPETICLHLSTDILCL